MSFSIQDLSGEQPKAQSQPAPASTQATPQQAAPANQSQPPADGTFRMDDLATPQEQAQQNQPAILPPQQEGMLSRIARKTQETVGKAIPQAAIPAMAANQKYLADPIHAFEQKMVEAGGEVGRAPAEVLTFFQNLPTYARNQAYGTPQKTIEEQAKEQHPVLSGAGEAVGEFGAQFITPTNLAIMTLMPEGKLAKYASALFTTQMAAGAKEEIQQAIQNWGQMSPQERAKALTAIPLQSLVTLMSAAHTAGEFKGEPKPTEAPKKGEGPRTVLRPTTKTIAGVEAPISAIAQENPSLATKAAAHIATPGLAGEFQRAETKPAATRQLISSLSQTAEDKINAHKALIEGKPAPEKITGTDRPGRHATIDDLARDTIQTSEKTYQRADAISQREQTQWEAARDKAIADHKAGIDQSNAVADQYNAVLGEDEEPMQRTKFNPDDVRGIPEKPKTFNELKSALDQAKANAASDDAAVREKAIQTEVPKADKAMDKFFADHSDEVSPAEYQSAKKLRAEGGIYDDIANKLRSAMNKEAITGNTMRGIEAVIDNKAKTRGQAPGQFKRLLGPDGYENWTQVSKLFDPVKDAPSGLRSWGAHALEYMVLNHLVPMGIFGKAAVEFMLNRIMFKPEWGSWFKNATEALKNRVVLPQALKSTFEGLMKNERGELGKPGSVPLTAEDEALAEEPKKPSFELSDNGEDENGNKNHILAINRDGDTVGHLNISQTTPDSWQVNDAVVRKGMTGQGLGRAGYEEAFKQAASKGMKTVESDISITSKAKGVWEALRRDHPEAITEENGQYVADLDKMGLRKAFSEGDFTSPEESQVAAHNKNGGSTFSAEGKDLAGTDAYAVGSYPERTERLDELTPEALADFKTRNADVLSQPDHMVGTWENPETGKHELDVSRMYRDRDEAMAAGRNANQIAIGHMKTFENIPTGGTGEVTNSARDISARYNKQTGRPAVSDAKVDVDSRGEKIADAYDKLKHEPTNPKVKASYDALIRETKDQLRLLEDNGYRIEPSDQDPYSSYEEMAKDVRDNRRLKVWTGGEPPADHPLSGIDPETGLSNNTLMRAVHDIMGHVAGDNDFTEKGEENAYQRHAQSYSDAALPALTTETKGQTSHYWHAEDVRSGGEHQFVQKATLLPEKYYARSIAEPKASRWPTDEKLLDKYGETSDPSQAAFLLTDGRSVAMKGTEHDRMLGGTPKDNLRTPYINETGNIRMRSYGAYGDRQFNFSLPKGGITQQQFDQIMKWGPQLRTGRVYMEMADPEGGHQVLQSPSNEDLGNAIKQMIPVAGEKAAPDLSKSEISTRRPTAVSANPANNPSRTVNLAALSDAAPSRTTAGGKRVMGLEEKLARTVATEPYSGVSYSPEDLKDPKRVIDKFVGHVSDNLEWMYNQVPPEIRNQTKEWYPSANKVLGKFAKQYDFTSEQTAGVTAALSPQNPWDNNVGLAKRMMETYRTRQNFDFSPEMEKKIADLKKVPTQTKAFKGLMRDIVGKKLSEIKDADPDVQAAQRALWIRLYDEAHNSGVNDMYSPSGEMTGHSPDTRSWIGLDHMAKAVKMMDDGSVQNIHDTMGQGHKIRNFYNNLINPNSKNGHVTIDTHAVAAGLLNPLGAKDTQAAHNFGGSTPGIPTPGKDAASGIGGTYPLYAEAYQRTAKKLGILPRELQSIVWEGVKSLMGDEKKTPQLKKAVREIWQDVQEGHLTADQARDRIKAESQGFSKPYWMSEEEWEKTAGSEGEDTSFMGEGERPKQAVSGDEVVKHVMKTASTTEEYARQLVGLDAGGDYTLENVPVDSIKTVDETVPRFVRQYAGMKSELPAIVLDMDGKIRDGNHRLAAAKMRGQKTIKAYVPIDSYHGGE